MYKRQEILKVEDAAGCDQEDNSGKCNQQIGGTVQLDNFGLPLPCSRKINVLRHSVFQNRIGSSIGTGRPTIDADNIDLFRLSACYGLIKLVGNKKCSNAVCKADRVIPVSYTHLDVYKRQDNSSTLGVYYCVWLFLYGFLALIALITVFNVINSIALSVSARTKQYGAFRAIGLSTRQLSRMVIAEASTYAITGCVVGTVLGLICNRVLFALLINSKWGDSWTIPWVELGIIVLIMVLSVVLAVRGPIKKMQKMSIVDTISAQ